MLGHALHQTVVGVDPPVQALDPLEARVFYDPERQLVLGTELFQLADHAIRDVRDALGVEAVHHGFDHVEFVFNAKVDEIGVDEDVVGRAELGVVLEEHGRAGLGLFHQVGLVGGFGLLFGRGAIRGFEPGVRGFDHPLELGRSLRLQALELDLFALE